MSMSSDVTVTAETLRRLHRIHQQLRDLQLRLDRGPRILKAHADNLARLQTQLDDARAKAKALHIALDDKQVQLKGREAHVQHRKDQLQQSKSNKEYQALKEEIMADEASNSVLADEILEAMERLDELTQRVKDAEAVLAKGQGDAAQAKAEVDRQTPLIQADMARLTDELKRAEQDLPSDFRNIYQRLVRSRGSDALAPLQNQSCGGCNQQIPINQVNALLMAKPIFCGGCGRLLYVPEDAELPGGTAAK